MAQLDQDGRDDYLGNGSIVDFAYKFEIANQSEVLVLLTSIVDNSVTTTFPILDDDYQVSGVGVDTGGTITFTEAPESGITIILVRNVPLDQETTFIEGSPFPAIIVNRAYDKLTQITQQLREEVKRSIKVPLMPNLIDGTLPDEIQVGDVVQVNDDLTGFHLVSVAALFQGGALTPHVLEQLANMSETTTITEGQWDFVGVLDQSLTTSDNVTFSSVNGATNLSELASLTAAEIVQLGNINLTTISEANWGFVASLNQDLSTGATPQFAGITIDGEDIGATTVHANQNFKTGTIENGIFSIASATEFNISAGSGIIVDYSSNLTDPDTIDVSWSVFTNVTLLNIGTGALKSIAINSSGSIIQTDDIFTELELRDLILIGTIFHNATDILSVFSLPRKSIGTSDIMTDLLTTLGILNRNGNVYSANGANLNADKTAGETFGLSLNATNSDKFANITTDAAEIIVTFVPIFRDGSGSFTVLAPTTTIDVTQYDDGSGTLQALTGNESANHRIAYSGQTGFTLFLYGQQSYTSVANALDAMPDPFVLLDAFFIDFDVRSILTARATATDLSDPSDAVFTEVNRFTASSAATSPIQAATLQSAYIQNPLINLTASNPVVLEVDSDTDKALSINDSGSSETYSVTGEGDVEQDGALRLTGIGAVTTQLRVTANAAQSSQAMGTYRNSAFDSILDIFHDQVNILQNDDDRVPFLIKGGASPTVPLLKIDDNSNVEIFSIDKDGQVLVKGSEIESGSGEVIIGYAEFDILSTTTQVVIDVPAFDNGTIVALRIEIRDLMFSVLGNDPGSIVMQLIMMFSTDGGITYKSTQTGNQSSAVTNGEYFSPNLRRGFMPGAFASESNPRSCRRISCIINVHNIPEFIGDSSIISPPQGMMLSSNGIAVFGSSNQIDICNNAGFFQGINDGSEAAETITNLKIFATTSSANPAESGFNMTSGSIKAVGIKSGGPSF